MYIACFEGIAHALRCDRIQFTLTVLAHVGERTVGVHVDQRAQLGVVDPNMRYHEVDPRIEASDHRHKAVSLVSWECIVLGIPSGLAEILRHAETILLGKPLGKSAKLRRADRGTHVIIDIVDLQPGMQRPLDLRPQLFLHFTDVGIIAVKGFHALKKIAVRIDQRWNGSTTKNGTPAIVLPFGIQRQVNTDRHFRVVPENVDGLLMPRGWKHHRNGNRNATGDDLLERHVDAVAHPAIVAPHDQIDRVGGGRSRGGQILSNAATGRGSNPQVNYQEQGERMKQPRTTLLETESGEILSSAKRVAWSGNAKLWTWDTLYYGANFRLSSTNFFWVWSLAANSRYRTAKPLHGIPVPPLTDFALAMSAGAKKKAARQYRTASNREPQSLVMRRVGIEPTT